MFVLYDNEANQYMYPYRANPHTLNVTRARQYKRKRDAMDQAALENVTRNIPPGWKYVPGVNNNHYQNRPQVEVREIDDQGNILNITVPLPSWITA
jgi:hypothetical protein